MVWPIARGSSAARTFPVALDGSNCTSASRPGTFLSTLEVPLPMEATLKPAVGRPASTQQWERTAADSGDVETNHVSLGGPVTPLAKPARRSVTSLMPALFRVCSTRGSSNVSMPAPSSRLLSLPFFDSSRVSSTRFSYLLEAAAAVATPRSLAPPPTLLLALRSKVAPRSRTGPKCDDEDEEDGASEQRRLGRCPHRPLDSPPATEEGRCAVACTVRHLASPAPFRPGTTLATI
mmetsp:Transcript_17106/g.34978  ORF Transcript_17106/g.34978 Transcript_17106/m.34978 type:complete len:235 (+) Transcript_17106:501-1205(+)